MVNTAQTPRTDLQHNKEWIRQKDGRYHHIVVVPATQTDDGGLYVDGVLTDLQLLLLRKDDPTN